MATTPLWTYRGVDTGLDLTGYEVEARDGSIGTVDAAMAQPGQSYIVVDTGTWILGKRALLPAGLVDRIDTAREKVFVGLSREQIRKAPEYEEAGATPFYRERVGSYYAGLAERGAATRSQRRPTSRRRPAKQASSSRRSTRSRSRASEGPTRDDLYEQAKRLGIEGRSKMNKAQLARAVGRKRGRAGTAQSRRSSSTRRRPSSPTGARRRANPVEVQRFLEGVSYPTRKGDLIRKAEREGASKRVRSTLEQLPDERFKDPTEVSEAVGRRRR